MLKYLKNKKVTVLGAGTSGIAVALLLKRKGVKVFISEQQPERKKYKEKKIVGKKGIPFEFGGHSEQIYETDVLVVSPGIALNDIRVKKARERGISVYGELEVAFWYCQAPVIAVTGSNGKSTTTELIGDIFKQAGRKHEVAGNIGRPFAEIADSITKESTAIIEVSSFQLETIKSFHPRVAIFLNLTPDHLDRHISLPEYGKLKARIFENQTEGDYLIYNGQDSYVSKLVKKSKSQNIVFNKKQSSNPCGYIDKEKLIFNIKGETKELIDLKALYLKGKHNAGNALAAALSARVMDIEWKPIRQSLETFKGLLIEWNL
ncbi:MAG: UDP-N-acetylmuramoyl-L-alanine--D-glutamate ligase [bacterium]